MSDWANTPIKQRLDSRQVKVVDTAQDAFVGAADSTYYDDVQTNAPEITQPSAPSSLTVAQGVAGSADVSWTDEGESSDGHYMYYITGTVADPLAVIAGGTAVTVVGGSPETVATGAGTWTFVVAGYNDFGTGPYSIATGTIT